MGDMLKGFYLNCFSGPS